MQETQIKESQFLQVDPMAVEEGRTADIKNTLNSCHRF